MSLSHTFVLNLKLERLCLAKKILKDCGSSTKPRVSLHNVGIIINGIDMNSHSTGYYYGYGKYGRYGKYGYGKRYGYGYGYGYGKDTKTVGKANL